MQTIRRIFSIVATVALMLPFVACHEPEHYENDNYGTFDCLVDLVSDHYCFFDEKGIDWESTAAEYRKRLVPDATQTELFMLCAEMLDELHDGHVNLSSPFDTSYYRRWWSDYPQDFDLRVVQQYYLDFDWLTTCGIVYKILPGNIGYLYYPSFSYRVGDGNLDYILSYLSVCDALIIDVRDNGGGNVNYIDTFVSRFIHTTITGAYICHKTGVGHDDFSEPYPITYTPVGEEHIVWDKPIALLTNRSTFSAANVFAVVMKKLGNVTVIGARTGGGGGMPLTYPLPNGWKLRLSASPMFDADMNSIESGINPTEGFECHSLPADFAAGKDPILDTAIAYLSN